MQLKMRLGKQDQVNSHHEWAWYNDGDEDDEDDWYEAYYDDMYEWGYDQDYGWTATYDGDWYFQEYEDVWAKYH
eukprot:1605863-Pyramimonas_sp.AAC.1